jgi:hypothetical protein
MTKRKRRGRPSKLTPKVQERIVSVIRAGNYAYVAAEYAGIGQSTFYRWLELGAEQKSGRYREFREAVKRAEAEGEVRAVAIIQKHMMTNWQAAMTYLERKFPQRWARRMDVTSGGRPFDTIRLVVLDPETGEEIPANLPPLSPEPGGGLR